MRMIARWMLAAALAVIVADSAQAQRGGGRGQGGMSIGLVLTNKDLQDELKVTDDQKGKLKEMTGKQTEMNKKRQELFGGGQPDRTQMQELQKEATALNEEIRKATDGVLTADQKKRYKQIEIQAMGLRAFGNAEIVKELNITEDQKSAMKEVTDGMATEVAALRKELGLPAQGGRPMAGDTPPDAEKMAEYAKKTKPLVDAALEKSVKALSADQKKQWMEMIGVKFDTSKLTVRPMRTSN